jgi:hypothetical protein
MADPQFTVQPIEPLPGDPYPVTFLNLNNTQYEYSRRYTTLEDPADIEKIVAERFAAVGIITTGEYIGLDITVSLGDTTRNYTSYIGVDSKPTVGIGTIRTATETHFKANLFSGINNTNSYAFYADGGINRYIPGFGYNNGYSSSQWGAYIGANLSNYFGGLVLIGGGGANGGWGGGSVANGAICRIYGDLYVVRRVAINGSGTEEDQDFELYVEGDAKITGTLVKGSGTFDIKHPLEETKRLRHSFVEGPRYDNIYRNKVRLKKGKASVNLDTDCVSPGGQTMTPGTWEKLNRNPDIFLQNLEGWSRLKGKITGSTLEIKCEDENCMDLISWMVVAERQDEHIINSDMSDDEGRLILEYDA